MNARARERRLTPSGLAALGEGRAPVGERLMSMLFLAGIVHAIVILGLSFSAGGRSGSAPGMEVLLVTEELPAARRNDHAVYLAQRTQLGAGNTRTLATGSPAPQDAAEPAALPALAEPSAAPMTTPGDERMLATTSPAHVIRWLGQIGDEQAAVSQAQHANTGTSARRGRGDALELVLRGDPKTGQWISPDTRASRLAPYLDAWRRKVERIGTLNFPTAAHHSELSGSPVIEVVLGSDGRLVDASVQRSSGHPELDQAALLILQLASPFEPFPRGLARDYGALRFAYQWVFFSGQVAAGSVTAGENGGAGP